MCEWTLSTVQPIITGRNEVLAKVIFSQACVYPQGGCLLQIFSGGCLLQIFWGVPAPNFRGEGACFKFSGGACSKFSGGGGACSKFSGGVPASNFRGGCLLQNFGGGACSKFCGGGACSKFSGGVPAPNFQGGVVLQFSEYGQRSAGTHPTGMHSCLANSSLNSSRLINHMCEWTLRNCFVKMDYFFTSTECPNLHLHNFIKPKYTLISQLHNIFSENLKVKRSQQLLYVSPPLSRESLNPRL